MYEYSEGDPARERNFATTAPFCENNYNVPTRRITTTLPVAATTTTTTTTITTIGNSCCEHDKRSSFEIAISSITHNIIRHSSSHRKISDRL